MKRHEKRFIIKRFIIEVNIGGDWQRSGNYGLQGFFATRKEANKALANGDKSGGMEYRVRQK